MRQVSHDLADLKDDSLHKPRAVSCPMPLSLTKLSHKFLKRFLTRSSRDSLGSRYGPYLYIYAFGNATNRS